MSDREFQPLSGDPDLLETKARHYQSIADAISRSTTTLKKIHDVDDMKSQATEALKSTADSVANDITKAHDRYDKTAKALLTYSIALRQAQSDAAAAIARINDRQGALDAAHSAVTTAQHHASTVSSASAEATPVDLDEARRAVTTAQHHAESVSGELSAAQQSWRNAREAKTSAAKIAHDAIENVVDRNNNGLKNPSFWEKALKALHDVLKVVCDIAGVLAIFLAWVPFLGEVLIVLAAVGALLDVLDAVINVINGTGSGWDIVFAVGTAAVTLFGGKIFAFAAKELRAGALVKSGLVETRALARLQGVGAHSKEFMSLESATKQLQKPLHTMFTSPFVRDEAQKAAMMAFKSGEKSAGDLIKAAAKEAFPALTLDPKKMLGVNTDLANYLKMVAQHPELANGLKAFGFTATAYQSVTTVTKLYNLPGKLAGDDATSTLLSGSDGSYKDVWDGSKSVVTGVPSAINSVQELFR